MDLLRFKHGFQALPSDKYIDGIDQSSFLLTENGKSHREHIYTWLGTEFMSLRMREYKLHLQVMQPQNAFQNIDFTTVSKVGLAPWLYNLYIDPKEELPVGHRLNAWLASMGAEAKMHAATGILHLTLKVVYTFDIKRKRQ